MRKFFLTLLGLLILVGQSFAVRAQNAATARLSFVDPQGFPTVTALLDVFDEQGGFITGLAENMTAQEQTEKELSRHRDQLEGLVGEQRGGKRG